MIEKLLNIFKNVVISNGLTGMLFGAWIAVVVVIIPDELLFITAGSMTPDLSLLLKFSIAAGIGSYLGGCVYYFAGYRMGKFLYKFIDKYGKFLSIKREEIEKAEKGFKDNGKSYVFWGRFVPGVKSVISIPAGVSKMNFVEYSILSFLGSWIWDTILLLLGYIFKTQIQTAFELLNTYEHFAYILLAISTIIYLCIHFFKKYKSGGEST